MDPTSEQMLGSEPPMTGAGDTGRRRLFINTAANAGAQLVSVLTTFILLPILMRAFGVANYGLFLLAASVSAYAYLLDLGIGVVLIRRVSERVATGRKSDVPGLLFSAATLYACIGVLAATLLVVAGRFAGVLFNVTPAQATLLEQLLWVGAALQLWYWPASTARHALAGLMQYGFQATTSAISSVGGALATVAVLVAGKGPLWLAIANGAVMIAVSLADMWFLRRRLRGTGRPRRLSWSTMKSLVLEGLPIFGVQIADMIMKQQTDRLVVGVFLGAAAVSFYEVAAKLSQLISQASAIMVSAVLPLASSLNAQKRVESMRSLFLNGSKYITLVMSPLILSATMLAGPFITQWLGPKFAASVPVAQALMLAQFFVPLYVMGDSVLISRNRFSKWLPFSLFLAAANLVLSVVLVLNYGLIGVAVGTLIACLLELPLYARLVLRELELPAARWLRTATLPAYPLLLVPAALCGAALATPITTSLWGVVLAGTVSLAAYWALAYFVALSNEDRRRLGGLVASILSPAIAKAGRSS
jgi:O-antigen/teichoic acid export membrane protein